MVKHCFVPGCKTNRWRKLWKGKRPALFTFPKAADLLEEWKRRIPKREREPGPSDSICSLHFKHTDILKFYEISGIQGQPKSKVERIERGCWSLDRNALPHYFNNDNPFEDLVIKEVKHRDQDGDHNYNLPVSDTGDGSDLSQESISDILIDHSYNLPMQTLEQSKSVSDDENDQQYTICDVHEDALELTLPARWAFIQNPEENSTSFVLWQDDMSVLRSVQFKGTCFPIITVNKQSILHRRVTCKEEIQELVEYVDGLKEND